MKMWFFSLLFLASLVTSVVFFLMAMRSKNRTKNATKGSIFLAVSYVLWLININVSAGKLAVVFMFMILAFLLVVFHLFLLQKRIELKKFNTLAKLIAIPLSLLFFMAAVGSIQDNAPDKKEDPKSTESASDDSYYEDNADTGYYDDATDDDVSSEEVEEDISVMDEDTLKDTLDEASSDYRYKVKSVKGVFDTEPYLVNITLNGTESLSTKLTFKSFEHDIADVLKVMKKNDYQDYEKISINVKYPMTDQYGNETDSYVIKSDFTPASIKKINFKEFYPGNLKDVANSWWVQPALKKYE
ncbi:hypothetical protein JRB95_001399 [Listeria monocytogenes]|nr:hypothetical protein [Listeria monocytogenes]